MSRRIHSSVWLIPAPVSALSASPLIQYNAPQIVQVKLHLTHPLKFALSLSLVDTPPNRAVVSAGLLLLESLLFVICVTRFL